ncbi:MAG: helix-turn-helix transcriptional regulator [Geodermatophilaceae bacterium]|nr:helix-turn-helix transcriptional regulator [Geodermatophilaceae bacterium]
MPHRWEQIEANLLLGDAAAAASDHSQALRAYDDAHTVAVQHGSVLRAADALDGYAAAPATIGALSGRAAGRAAQLVRQAHGAVPRPRPWLAGPVRAATARVPVGWVRDGRATAEAVVALRRAAAVGAADTAAGPFARFSRSAVAVAQLVAAGCTNREIGERLHISRRTVETPVAHAFQKLDVRTRAHLAAIVTASTR